MYERLMKTVDKTISLIKKTTNLPVNDFHKPLSGKEKSLFPLLMTAGWQSGFIVCPEIKVFREEKRSSGAVDAIFFDTEYEQDFVVEAKISTRRSEKGDVSSIREKLKQAKSQLNDVRRSRNGLSPKYGLVSCLIIKIVYDGKSEKEAQDKHDSFTKQRLEKIERDFSKSDKFYCKCLRLKTVHKTHNKNSLNKSKVDSESWCGAVCIILEFVRRPS